MWVEFFVGKDTDDSVTITAYAAQGEDRQNLPPHASTEKLLQYLMEKSRLDAAALLGKEVIKVNMNTTDFEKLLVEPRMFPPSIPTATPGSEQLELAAVLQQLAQTQQILTGLLTSKLGDDRPKFELTKPDPFDGKTSCPSAWMGFYEYACTKNFWTADEDRITNLRLFLTGMAKKWYELRILDHMDSPWIEWKASFLESFGENPVDRWDKAIFYKFRSGTALEYFYEKRRLLQLADPKLSPQSTVALIVHGLPKDVQKQVQVRAPKTIEGLLQCLKELSITAPAIEAPAKRTDPWKPSTAGSRDSPRVAQSATVEAVERLQQEIDVLKHSKN